MDIRFLDDVMFVHNKPCKCDTNKTYSLLKVNHQGAAARGEV